MPRAGAAGEEISYRASRADQADGQTATSMEDGPGPDAAGAAPAAAPAHTGPAPADAAPATLKWTQGDQSGKCLATNAKGLLAALKAAGVVLTGEQDVVVRMGRFMRKPLPTLLSDPALADPHAPPLNTEYTIECTEPKEHATAVLSVDQGDQASTVQVKKPVTATTIAESLIASKHVATEAELQGAKLIYQAASMELYDVLQEAPAEEVMALFAEGGEAPLAPEEIKIQLPVDKNEASRKAILMQLGWPYVLELIQHLLREKNWKQGELASRLGVSESIISQIVKGSYISDRCKTNGGKMTDNHAEGWARAFDRVAEGGEADLQGEFEQGGGKRKRAAKFDFKGCLMGGESVECYLHRAPQVEPSTCPRMLGEGVVCLHRRVQEALGGQGAAHRAICHLSGRPHQPDPVRTGVHRPPDGWPQVQVMV